MPILYALISREKTVLAEHAATSTTGNFATVTRVLLDKMPKNDGKMTYVYDDYVFHYEKQAGICYLCKSWVIFVVSYRILRTISLTATG
mmetsp:Transcript_26795/g.65151  ORF Transcript_26795/g.65151 Transcript_26795/m.65151 type:complete len:89 (-) Transcript_26795:855-1121(-)